MRRCGLMLLAVWAGCASVRSVVRCDLDGDGKPEEIRVSDEGWFLDGRTRLRVAQRRTSATVEGGARAVWAAQVVGDRACELVARIDHPHLADRTLHERGLAVYKMIDGELRQIAEVGEMGYRVDIDYQPDQLRVYLERQLQEIWRWNARQRTFVRTYVRH